MNELLDLLRSIGEQASALAAEATETGKSVELAQARIDASVAEIHDIAEITRQENIADTPFRKEHYDRKIWRKHFPTLTERSLSMMMEWRKRNSREVPLDRMKWPHCIVQDVEGGLLEIVSFVEESEQLERDKAEEAEAARLAAKPFSRWIGNGPVPKPLDLKGGWL